MSTRYGIIGDELWDLDIEEPVEMLSDTDALDEAYLNEFLAQAMDNLDSEEDECYA
jgi:hypothetical protein